MKQFRAGKLLVKIYETREMMGKQAAAEAAKAIRETIIKKNACNIIFAAAPSQNEFLEALSKSDVDWGKVNAFHMDEYIGLPQGAPQSFGKFLERTIFSKIPLGSIHYINGQAENLQMETERYSKFLRENPTDLVFMGIGENGHIAFNDPHVSHFDSTNEMQVVELDEKCRQQQVNDGCFSQLSLVPEKAFTITVPRLIDAGQIFCIVPAPSKAWAVKETVTGEIRETLPASILRMCPNAVLYLDADSAKLLDSDCN